MSTVWLPAKHGAMTVYEAKGERGRKGEDEIVDELLTGSQRNKGAMRPRNWFQNSRLILFEPNLKWIKVKQSAWKTESLQFREEYVFCLKPGRDHDCNNSKT